MKIEKLTIIGEDGKTITALFNPSKLVLAKSVILGQEYAKEENVPESQFVTGEPRTLTIDLLFDTYDTPEAEKTSVKEKYTDPLLKLMLVDNEKHRPQICQLVWGKMSMFFQGVLEKLDQQFTLFMEDGTPVRATCACTFKEWRASWDSQLKQKKSSDVAKTWVVKRGDTLSSIAAKEYLDPCLWRPIAEANAIDDPYDITPGRMLLIPPLTPAQPIGRH